MKRREFWILSTINGTVEEHDLFFSEESARRFLYENSYNTKDWHPVKVTETIPGEDDIIKDLVAALEYYANVVEPEMKKNYESAIALWVDQSQREHIQKLKLPAQEALEEYRKWEGDES